MAAATTAAAAAVVSSTAATARADDTAAARRKRYDHAQSTLQKTLRPSTTAPTVEICVRPQLAQASAMLRQRGRGEGVRAWRRGHGSDGRASDGGGGRGMGREADRKRAEKISRLRARQARRRRGRIVSTCCQPGEVSCVRAYTDSCRPHDHVDVPREWTQCERAWGQAGGRAGQGARVEWKAHSRSAATGVWACLQRGDPLAPHFTVAWPVTVSQQITPTALFAVHLKLAHPPQHMLGGPRKISALERGQHVPPTGPYGPSPWGPTGHHSSGCELTGGAGVVAKGHYRWATLSRRQGPIRRYIWGSWPPSQRTGDCPSVTYAGSIMAHPVQPTRN